MPDPAPSQKHVATGACMLTSPFRVEGKEINFLFALSPSFRGRIRGYKAGAADDYLTEDQGQPLNLVSHSVTFTGPRKKYSEAPKATENPVAGRLRPSYNPELPHCSEPPFQDRKTDRCLTGSIQPSGPILNAQL